MLLLLSMVVVAVRAVQSHIYHANESIIFFSSYYYSSQFAQRTPRIFCSRIFDVNNQFSLEAICLFCTVSWRASLLFRLFHFYGIAFAYKQKVYKYIQRHSLPMTLIKYIFYVEPSRVCAIFEGKASARPRIKRLRTHLRCRRTSSARQFIFDSHAVQRLDLSICSENLFRWCVTLLVRMCLCLPTTL